MSGADSPRNDGRKPGGSGLRAWLAYAFAVRAPGGLSPEDLALLDRVAGQVARRGLTGPVILALESVRPLSFLGSQVLVALKPFAELILAAEDYDRFTCIMERREGVEILLQRIEKAEADTIHG